MSEYSLFITDPADSQRKYVGSKQVRDDGSVVWFRRVGVSHVMRIGQFGLDASTYDTQFAGRNGLLRIQQGDITWEVDLATFERLRSEKDYGHGRQYFLDFSHWQSHNATSPLRNAEPPTPLYAPRQIVFGETMQCQSCVDRTVNGKKKCSACGGTGLVPARRS